MAKVKNIVLTKDLTNALIEAGIAPPNCQRMIIDVNWEDALVHIYYQCLGDESLLEAELLGQIKAIIQSAEKKEPNEQ